MHYQAFSFSNEPCKLMETQAFLPTVNRFLQPSMKLDKLIHPCPFLGFVSRIILIQLDRFLWNFHQRCVLVQLTAEFDLLAKGQGWIDEKDFLGQHSRSMEDQTYFLDIFPYAVDILAFCNQARVHQCDARTICSSVHVSIIAVCSFLHQMI